MSRKSAEYLLNLRKHIHHGEQVNNVSLAQACEMAEAYLEALDTLDEKVWDAYQSGKADVMSRKYRIYMNHALEMPFCRITYSDEQGVWLLDDDQTGCTIGEENAKDQDAD